LREVMCGIEPPPAIEAAGDREAAGEEAGEKWTE
jgi:hypothetical protein